LIEIFGGVRMSVRSATLFVERMTTDQDFFAAVTYCEDSKARKVFVKEAGFDFTAAEVKGLGREPRFFSESPDCGGEYGSFATSGAEFKSLHVI